MSKLETEIGRRFGRLTVLGENGRSPCRSRMYLCRCDCGKETAVRANALRSGNTKSCGCWARDRARFALALYRTKHGCAGGGRKTSEYNAWCCLRERCARPNHPFWKHYGGRGITVCDRWLHSFENFLADVGPRPGPGYSIDRINNDGNYEPGNVRWATRTQQANNQRRRRKCTA